MSRPMTGRRARDESGAVVVLLALSFVGVAMIAALVLDQGQVHADQRSNKGVTDVAAQAGVSRLAFGPWSGVCRAREYLLTNAKSFSAFDAGSETWSNAASPPTAYPSTPCLAGSLAPDVTPCAPNNPATWAKLQATAAGGNFTIEIQSGYALPDPRYSEDTGRGDTGKASQGSCDNLAVIVTQRRAPSFAQIGGFGSQITRARSVGRLNAIETVDFVAALQLLEQTKCNVLNVSGNNTRVIAQPFGDYPGTIQIDSAASGSCPSPILNAGAGPSAIACSTNSTTPGCLAGTGARASRIGIFALNYSRPASYIASPYPTHYGDTPAVASPRTGRTFADRRYRQSVFGLDAQVQTILTANLGNPPGCGPVSLLSNQCTGTDGTWLVVNPVDCLALPTFFADPGRSSAPRIWFNCDLSVASPLSLTGTDSYIVVNGQLSVSSDLTVRDARKLYVKGRAGGNTVGLDVTGGTLAVNLGGHADCVARAGDGPGHANRMVVGDGSFKAGSGATIRLCQTFVHLANGFGKVPATDGTPPCQTTACSTYKGTIGISSGSFVDWSAPNEIVGRLASADELTNTHKFEDLALWTEAGGNSNSISGGGQTSMSGSFFMPNADSFNLAGGGTLPVYLSAQFIATSMKVTGGATVSLVPNPLDSIPTSVYNTLLVR